MEKLIDERRPMARLIKSITIENLWLYILSILSKRKAHAYAMNKEIKKKFGWEAGVVTPYIVLYKLEKDGFIKSAKVGRRVVYKITRKGRRILIDAKKLLRKISRSL